MGRTAKILLGTAAALALLIALFDWNWFRPAVVRYFVEESGRDVRAGHLSVAIDFSLEPTVTFRDLVVPNAAWADSKQPMAVAGEVSFSFSLRSVWDDKPVISKIVLKDAQVNMLKLADGHRNWRLKDPDYLGPARIKILSLEAHRTTLRFADRGLDFDLHFDSREPEPLAVTKETAKPLTQALDVKGVYRGGAFTAQVLTGPILTFQETREYFPVRGHAIAGKTRLDLDGMVADMIRGPLLDAKVRIAGPTLSQLHPFIKVQPAVSRPYSVEAQVQKAGDKYSFAGLRGKIGATDLAGDASHDMRGERAYFRADMISDSADLSDLRSLMGIDHPGVTPTASSATRTVAARKARNVEATKDRLFPRSPFKPERWRDRDADIKLNAKKLKASDMPGLDSLSFTAALQDGVLKLDPVNIGIAGGYARGQIMLDARKQPPASRAALTLAGLSLERLFPKLPEAARSVGRLNGRMQLQGQGDSVALALGGASGKLDIEVKGGSISRLLDAKLSLDLGKIAGMMLRGDRDIPFHCGVAGFDFVNGRGTARRLLVETDETRIEGSGALSLRDESMNLLLTPQPKKPGLLNLGAVINVRGTFKHPAFDVDKGTGRIRAAASNNQCSASAPPPVAGARTEGRPGA